MDSIDPVYSFSFEDPEAHMIAMKIAEQSPQDIPVIERLALNPMLNKHPSLAVAGLQRVLDLI